MTSAGTTNQNNLVAELTPVGRGAVAVVILSGPDTSRLVDQNFLGASGTTIGAVPCGCIRFGRWGGPEGEELIVCRRANDRVEIHCHGGVAAVANVINRLKEQGCREVSWRDWLRHDSNDPIRAAAQIALADARTARTAAILIDQYHGALSAELHTAHVAAAKRDWERAGNILEGILEYRDIGAHLTLPWRVVLAGAPNVGKSSLINALAGYSRAIVSSLPGTTRDVVTTCTAIDGWPVELADTAGWRATEDPLESAGVELANVAVSRADLILLVHDASQAETKTVEWRSPMRRMIHVWNKIDLVGGSPSIETARHSDVLAVSTSAVTGVGIRALVNAIGEALVPIVPPRESAVAFTNAQFVAIESADAAIACRDETTACRALQALLAS